MSKSNNAASTESVAQDQPFSPDHVLRWQEPCQYRPPTANLRGRGREWGWTGCRFAEARKRKRSPTAHGLSPPKSVKYSFFLSMLFWLWQQYRDFSALKKYYRLASRNIPRFIHPWVNVQGIVLHRLLVNGILDLLAEDEEEDAENDNDSEMKESEMPEWVPSTYIDLNYWQPRRNFWFMHSYMHIMTFLFPHLETHISQLEDLDSSDPLRTVFEIFAAVIPFSSRIH